ncbi:MAG: proline dehydrogenase family protein [Bacteroidia bacterium]|nr:proline dehydrogenase family protein [Bacteroidia bacterium]
MSASAHLNNTLNAYRYKSSKELRSTYFIFKMLKNPLLVRLLSEAASGILKYNIPLKSLIKNTVFKIFCSGENINEAFATIKKLDKFKVKAVLDYVAESEKSANVFSENTKVIVANILRLGKEAPGNSVSVKFTSLEDMEFFKTLNKFLLTGKSLGSERYSNLLRRVDEICSVAAESKVVVYFDAEDRFMQDIFDKIVEVMMEKYNKEEAIIYNTLQMYLTDRLYYLRHLLEDSANKSYYPGIKLVRGAYAEKERYTAAAERRESPVYATKDLTDEAFNTAIELCLRDHHRVYTCIASHNEKSTELALNLINRYHITDHFKKVKFSQLYGMRDNLTFNLGEMGYNASKYLPYGEVKKAIPYLIRRAEENSSIGPQLIEELTRLENEINRRKTQSKTENV